MADLPEGRRITAHVAMVDTWTVRPRWRSYPLLWSLCGDRVVPGPPQLRYVRRCSTCRRLVGPDYWPDPEPVQPPWRWVSGPNRNPIRVPRE